MEVDAEAGSGEGAGAGAGDLQGDIDWDIDLTGVEVLDDEANDAASPDASGQPVHYNDHDSLHITAS